MSELEQTERGDGGATAAARAPDKPEAAEVADAEASDLFSTPFDPHPLIRGGHLQTAAALMLAGATPLEVPAMHLIDTRDKDVIALHDNRPSRWQDGDRVAVLVHGLEGDHTSGALARLTGRLLGHEVRTFRMDQRCCGAVLEVSARPYHAGRSADVADAVAAVAKLCPNSPITVIGISMGGNMTLKFVGEAGRDGCPALDSAIAICPPVDLALTVENIEEPRSRLYQQFFVYLMNQRFDQIRERIDPEGLVDWSRRADSIRDYDSRVTAPLGGFGSASEYYKECSAAPFLGEIKVPTLIVAARDDPLIPAGPLESATLSESTQVMLTDGGGHVGFFSRGRRDPDRYWLDWRLLDWLKAQGHLHAA